MRCLLATLLTGLILTCPFLCKAEEDGRGAQHHHSPGSTENGEAPGHCPDSTDNCVCRGAVQSSGVRTSDQGVGTHFPPAFVAPSLPTAHPLSHLTWGGSPTGLAGWGDSLTVRALLQNFRC